MSNVEDRPPRTPYRRFTRTFDIETGWRDLRRVLGRKAVFIDPVNSPSASPESLLVEAWRWRDAKHPGWRDGLRAAAAETARRLSASPGREALSDVALTLLIDHSGSMRGEPMQYTAAAIDILQAALTGVGIKLEVLGFTTRYWRGGESLWWWRLRGSKPQPGRLNDLLHVIYRDAAEPAAGETPDVYREMLRPELLKENLDGEALEWAADRLRRRPERRKVLMILSDGAPVDDATLLNNHTHFLEDHLLDVIGGLEAAGDIELHGFGLGHAVDRYYGRSTWAEEPASFGSSLLACIETALTS